MRVFLSALLPAPDGAGWFVVQEGERPHRCSARECENMAIAYHHTLHVGQEKLWRNRYRCGDHTLYVGEVERLAVNDPAASPLLFYGGRYGTLEPYREPPGRIAEPYPSFF